VNLPVTANPCPSAERSQRAEIKALLADLYRRNSKIKGNIFRALRHVRTDYLLK
ncbi:tRNA 2-thiocytidine(32) synthetase TtcA, partial [bacterium]|nr:tRNA 2-thiocytidine(32) synthetase TtcA [bacterium]